MKRVVQSDPERTIGVNETCYDTAWYGILTHEDKKAIGRISCGNLDGYFILTSDFELLRDVPSNPDFETLLTELLEDGYTILEFDDKKEFLDWLID